MTAIAIFNGLFCEADSVAKQVAEITGYRLISDKDVIVDAARLSGLEEQEFNNMLLQGVFCCSSRKREQLIAWIRLAVAKLLTEEQDVILAGYAALVPPASDAILRVCLISEMGDRIQEAQRTCSDNQDETFKKICCDDQIRCDWVISLTDSNDPWASSLYDMVIPATSLGARQSACLIVKQLAKSSERMTDSNNGISDFLLSSSVHAMIADKGYGLKVSLKDGNLKVRLKDHDSLLKAMARDFSESVAGMNGVKSVDVSLGRSYSQGDIYNKAGLRSAFQREDITKEVVQSGGALRYVVGRQEDYELAARVQANLSLLGYPVSVYAKDGTVSLIITNHKAMLAVFARRLCAQVESVDGVHNVEVGIGTGYHQATVSNAARRDMAYNGLSDPDRKVELALSPRLQTPESTLVVYDENALSRIEDSEILILDVNMADLDGIEVLRRLKRDHPAIPVIIFASRESAADRETCLDLGACAYLNKPVQAGMLRNIIQAIDTRERCFSP